jgi:hypothetical protein
VFGMKKPANMELLDIRKYVGERCRSRRPAAILHQTSGGKGQLLLARSFTADLIEVTPG